MIAELAAIGLSSQRHQTGRIVERASAGRHVVFETVGGQTPFCRREDDVALGNHAVCVLEHLDLVGEQRRLWAERQFDLPGQNAVLTLARERIGTLVDCVEQPGSGARLALSRWLIGRLRDRRPCQQRAHHARQCEG